MFAVDTHAHLNFNDYESDRDEVIKRTLNNNLGVINVGVEFATSKKAVELARRVGRGFFAAVGLHPNYVMPPDLRQSGNYKQHDYEDFDMEKYRELANSPDVAAIGEIGLDYSRFKDEKLGIGEGEREMKNAARIKELQKEIFQKQIELAFDLGKPILIHCRKAHNDILDLLALHFPRRASKCRGIAHSFLGNLKQARRYRELGFKIAFNGIITFARDYDKVILDTPLEDILLETDCPYLAPAPHRGERNEPLYVLEVAKKLAELKNVPYREVLERTTENAKEVLKIL